MRGLANVVVAVVSETRRTERIMRLILTAIASIVVLAIPIARAQTRPAAPAPADGKPTLFLVGDSTVKNGTKGQRGWGEEIDKYFDTSRITIANRAIGGR